MGDIKGPVPSDATMKETFTAEDVCMHFSVPMPDNPIMGRIDLPPATRKDLGLKHEDFEPAPAQLGQIVVEVDLGPDDVLLLTCEQALRYGVAERYAAELRAVLEKPGRQAIVIDAGMVPMVLHRTIPAEDKARKAKPYLEDMARPSASERAVDADIQDAVRTTSAADVSRGTSEDGKA